MRVLSACALLVAACLAAAPAAQGKKYVGGDGKLRVALTKQPLSPTGPSKGPDTMASGGIQKILADLGATVRVEAAALTPDEETEYGGWKRLGISLGHFADIVSKNERGGVFTVGLLATCPSMPGLVAGLQHSGPTREPIRIGMLWLDAHPDFNTPETTRSGSLGGMPVAVATGRALQVLRLDAWLDPPLAYAFSYSATMRSKSAASCSLDGPFGTLLP
jgi:arginase family enzyme